MNNAGFDLSKTVLPREVEGYLKSSPPEKLFYSFPGPLKAEITEAMVASFTEAAIGVRFEGFQDCSVNRSDDVVLTLDKRSERSFVASTEHLQYQLEMFKGMHLPSLNDRVSTVSQKQLMGAVVHEMMHVLGMDHEFLQKSGFGMIKDFDTTPKLEMSQEMLSSASEHWSRESKSKDLAAFDIFSVMNYQLQTLNEFAIQVEAVCLLPHTSLSSLQKRELCQADMIKPFAPDSNSDTCRELETASVVNRF